MGNNQSSPSSQNRLTKPKTNSNSPPALVVDSPESFRYADLSAKGRQQVKEVLLSPVETAPATTWSNKDEDTIAEAAPRGRGRPLSFMSRSNSRVQSRSESLSCFGSRQGSTTRLTDLQSSKLSLASANSQADIEAAIRLLQEVKKNASPEDLAALHEALGSSTDSPVSVTEPELGRRTSARNSSLTRRRSLVQTPGLATRNSPIDGRRRTWNSWKAPQVAPDEEAKWSLANRRAALKTVEDGKEAPTVRAQTPGELDYCQLGSLKGLTIMNGAPSPAPSSRTLLQQKPRVAVDDDYFTVAPDASSSPLTMKTNNRRGHVKSKSLVVPAASPLHDSIAELDGTMVHSTAHTASQYAEDYQAGLPSSPFANSQTFESVNAIANTVVDAPNTANQNVETSWYTVTTPDSITVPISPPVLETAAHQRTAKLSQRPTPHTSDSGYSSGGSLRTGSRGGQSTCAATGNPTSLSIPDRSDISPEPVLSPGSIRSSASKSSIGDASSTHKRLQKRRKSQPILPSVQSCRSPTESVIPDIPETVKAKFTRRLSYQPGMSALSQTYPSKDHVTVDSTTRDYTADSPTFGQHNLYEDRQIAETGHREVSPLTEIEPERAPTPPPHAHRRNLSLFRRKSTTAPAEANEDFASNTIVDLGTIASSLGSSPYDAAMSRPLRASVTSPTHPHQLGANLPRAKSIVHMDAEAAAEFARMRSKDRALMEQENKPHQRSRSYHNLRMEAGEAKASKRRPKSFLHDVPPVPTIDSSKIGRQDVSSPVHKREQTAHSPPPSARPRLEGATHETESTSSDGAGQRVVKRVSQYDQRQLVDWEAHSHHWSQRRKSIGEGLRSHAGFSEASASTVNSRNMPQPRHHLVDRYSGGLQYGYEGGGSFHGSAGTRQLHSTASSKSLHWRNQYGVDLSDVPIMLQQQRV